MGLSFRFGPCLATVFSNCLYTTTTMFVVVLLFQKDQDRYGDGALHQVLPMNNLRKLQNLLFRVRVERPDGDLETSSHPRRWRKLPFPRAMFKHARSVLARARNPLHGSKGGMGMGMGMRGDNWKDRHILSLYLSPPLPRWQIRRLFPLTISSLSALLSETQSYPSQHLLRNGSVRASGRHSPRDGPPC
jgi:hypothetical protein